MPRLDGYFGGSTVDGLCDLLNGFAFELPPVLEEMRKVLRPDFGEHTQGGPVAANRRQQPRAEQAPQQLDNSLVALYLDPGRALLGTALCGRRSLGL